MYEMLEPVAQDLNTLEAVLSAPDAKARMQKIAEAFDETTRRISEATQAAVLDDDRIALQKLYRGFVAARRIAMNLYEQRQ